LKIGLGMGRRLQSDSGDPSTGTSDEDVTVKMAYNGFGQLVTEYQEHSGAVSTSNTPKVQYAYAGGSDNHIRPTSVTYPSGRTIAYDYAGSADVARIKYGYDRASNRTYREVVTDPNDAHDEPYGYDGTHRLSDFDRGSLNAAKDAISSLELAQQWSLDPTGNWAGFKEDTDGDSTWDLDQSRSHNPVNEITDITETAGSAWATPAHDRAGNMTTLPQPADPTQTYSGVWDGWNRLVKLVDDATSNPVQESA
jgi:hypothetical protein